MAPFTVCCEIPVYFLVATMNGDAYYRASEQAFFRRCSGVVGTFVMAGARCKPPGRRRMASFTQYGRILRCDVMDLSILSLLAQATLVAKAVLVVLVIMSVASWALMFRKWLNIRSAMKKAADGMDRFNHARDLREAVQALGGDPDSPLYTVAHEGVTEFNRSKEAGNTEDVVVDNVRRSLRQGVDMEMTRISKSLPFLATSANTAPFIGLFGTVWGIMSTFHAIGAMKSASLATVAPGISEALIATAMGLLVAIPATVGYNSFSGQLGVLETRLVNFAGMFLNRVQRELNAHRPVSRAGQE